VRAAVGEHPEVVDVAAAPGCTACEPERFYSHRARGDAGRHAATVVLGP
jgi:copper oxidase (laccase) domain-containing protein